MDQMPATVFVLVHCRIGSLENQAVNQMVREKVHCRIGSLEICMLNLVYELQVHCRIGSLESEKKISN